MNINQMKSAIRRFRQADVSIINDEKTRAKAQKLQAKQGGFTLLELLVVITLLATLATAALVAYQDVGENAADASAATALTTMEGALRNYRAIEGEYPEQFDNLANADADTTNAATATTGAMRLMSAETKAFFGQLSIPGTTVDASAGVFAAISNSLAKAGLEELQSIQGTTAWNDGFVPNLAMNESYGETNTAPGSEIEFTGGGALFDGNSMATNSFTNFALSIVPSNDSSNGCDVFAADDLTSSFDGTAVSNNTRLNLISDALGSNECNLVVALGIGKEVPGATAASRVAIGQVPTVGTTAVNPANNYARAIALFHVGQDGADGTTADGAISATEIFSKARLIAVVDPEGRTIDQVVAAARATADDDA
jgi:prepilin-type N-terminal cleavage/methylation domain-containing protein